MPYKGTKNVPKDYGRARKRKYWVLSNEEVKLASTSAQKIRESKSVKPELQRDFGYCLLNFYAVFSALATLVHCNKCHKEVKFTQRNNVGLGFKLCVVCECNETTIDSSPSVARNYEINCRIVFIMRLLGVGREGLRLFVSLMDICSGFPKHTYYECVKNIYSASSAVYDLVISLAAQEEKERTEGTGQMGNYFTVSGDGTWMKRGFSSLYGASSIIGKYSKKVVDSIVKSKFCQSCRLWEAKKEENPAGYETWREYHSGVCAINHSGSSAKMEVDAMIEMFSRSVELHGAYYTMYIGDGDSKTFKGIVENNPYGDKIQVTKKECVGHIEKRMGSRLRNLKKTTKGLGGKGKGKLTDSVINALTKYYGLAIRRHPDSVAEMKKGIWATYFHKSSTDRKPSHENCPLGVRSWCTWRQAEAAGTLDQYRHKPSLSDEVLKHIKPVYEALSDEDLLQRCLGAETQNSNESLNALIWTFAPKHLYCGAKIVEIANFLAVLIFNGGFGNILKVLEEFGSPVGRFSTSYANSRDDERINRAERRVTEGAKRARIEQRERRLREDELDELQEGILYAPGLGDD